MLCRHSVAVDVLFTTHCGALYAGWPNECHTMLVYGHMPFILPNCVSMATASQEICAVQIV